MWSHLCSKFFQDPGVTDRRGSAHLQDSMQLGGPNCERKQTRPTQGRCPEATWTRTNCYISGSNEPLDGTIPKSTVLNSMHIFVFFVDPFCILLVLPRAYCETYATHCNPIQSHPHHSTSTPYKSVQTHPNQSKPNSTPLEPIRTQYPRTGQGKERERERARARWLFLPGFSCSA